jgi:hypothetical protein
METKVVSYKKGNDEYRLVVSEETAISRLRRGNLKLEAVKNESVDPDLRIMHLVFYPDCIAGVIDWGSVTKPTFEEFALLPGQFVDDWASAVWELNPDWQPKIDSADVLAALEEDEKKLENLINASSE